jgi:hypothetical protein
VSISESGLTHFILSVILGGSEAGVTICGNDGWNSSSWDSVVSNWGGRSNWIVSTISKELSFGGNSQHQQTGDLCEEKNKRIILKYLKKTILK